MLRVGQLPDGFVVQVEVDRGVAAFVRLVGLVARSRYRSCESSANHGIGCTQSRKDSIRSLDLPMTVPRYALD